jgi:DNA-binding YbaB/EbfC family protein
MANIVQMLKQAATLQRDMKRVQRELEKTTSESVAAGGKIRAVARGDMTIQEIRVDPEWLKTADAASLERGVAAAVNSALATAKKEAGREISKLTSGLGLPPDLLS